MDEKYKIISLSPRLMENLGDCPENMLLWMSNCNKNLVGTGWMNS